MNMGQIFRSFFLIGLGSYGGGMVAISLVFDVVVSRWGWMTAEGLSRFITLSQMTPGPIALNAATYIGYTLQGIPGSLLATLAVISPSILLLGGFFLIRDCRALNRGMERIDGKRIVNALKPGILGLLVNAAYVFTRNAIVDPVTAVIFTISLAVFLFVPRIHPVFVVIAAGVAGIFLFC